jgi:hypothetical protein
MSLAGRIGQANSEYHTKFICKLMRVTLDPKLSQGDIDALITTINSPPLSENHIASNRLALALRAEGYDVSISAVERHRRGSCPCSRIKEGQL